MRRLKQRKQYQARPGFHVNDKQAQDIGDTVDGLKTKTKEEFLKAASKKRSPVNSLFNWDDESAARAHRLSQAGYFMRAIVEIEIETKEPVRSFHAVEFETVEPGMVFKRHEEILHNTVDLEYLSGEFYGVIKSSCKKAEDLGMDKLDIAWKKIIAAVRKNPPTAINDIE